jgi:ABC-type phosphate/phosphonate transport system permease subunit
MEIISRHRWHISIASAITLLALILSLAFAFTLRVQTHAAGAQLTQISSDPYTSV